MASLYQEKGAGAKRAEESTVGAVRRLRIRPKTQSSETTPSTSIVSPTANNYLFKRVYIILLFLSADTSLRQRKIALHRTKSPTLEVGQVACVVPYP